MFKIRIFFFSANYFFLLISTSIIKNKTREIEKNIYNISMKINKNKKDLNESQLDFSYLTSPSMIEKSIEHVRKDEYYFAMELSKIFLSFNKFQIKKLQVLIANTKFLKPGGKIVILSFHSKKKIF